SKEEILDFYRNVVKEISGLIPQGSISIEVYAVSSTKADEMLKQGREMFSWIPNGHIKFPSAREGLKAAEKAVKEGMRINMTLCFTQQQAAAVYAATQGAKRGDVFVSPFIGRLDDREEKGMDLIAHILKMYQRGDGHVEVLTASVRNIEHLLYALKLGSDIITAPFKVLREWVERGLTVPGNEYVYNSKGLKPIPYENVDLTRNWEEFDIYHDLTVNGMETFSSDWDSLIRKT
ncbi:MAG: transaldolase, partial [Nitrospirae bacterium RBG_13_43_8]